MSLYANTLESNSLINHKICKDLEIDTYSGVIVRSFKHRHDNYSRLWVEWSRKGVYKRVLVISPFTYETCVKKYIFGLFEIKSKLRVYDNLQTWSNIKSAINDGKY